MRELNDTPNLASSYCPRCDPERDPVREIVTVRRCEEHWPPYEGADDERAIVRQRILESAGEAHAATNHPGGELVRRALCSKILWRSVKLRDEATTAIKVADRVVGGGLALALALALILTLDASIQEFTELVALSNDARRERFRLPPACTPIISGVKPAGNASRLVVFVECSAPPTVPSSPIKPASWKTE